MLTLWGGFAIDLNAISVITSKHEVATIKSSTVLSVLYTMQ